MAETSPGKSRIKWSTTLVPPTTGGGTESLPSSEQSDLPMVETHFASQETTSYQVAEKCINGWYEKHIHSYMPLAHLHGRF